MKLRNIILKYALQNALFHGGKANTGAVMGKVISENRDLKSNVKEVKSLVEQIVRQVNLMPIEEQRKELEKFAPELLEKKKKEQKGLPDLPNAEEGEVTTRFAPSPTGPVNLGQFMRAVMLSYAYAKMYKGTFILRIEDTDAKKIDPEAYRWIKEDLVRMGTKWDKLIMQSDRIETYYKNAKKLLKEDKAYVCTCSAENFREYKRNKKDCPCRGNPVEKNLELWDAMVAGKLEEGSAIVRFKISMSSMNPVLRDPPLLRINKTPHPRKGTKYAVWPLYNFACTIDDYDLGVTHVFRGKEHEHNTAVQKAIAKALDFEKFPTIVNFGMIRFPGEKLHTRDIKKMISEGKVSGWDDPKLPTIRAFLRRGFHPDAIKMLALQCGLSKNDIEISWENLESINRKIIDPLANRYMVVIDPVQLSVENAPGKREVFEPLHPDHPERGKKKIILNPKKIYISRDDYEKFKGQVIRLKGLFNISLVRKTKYISNEILKDMPKVQWVSEPHVNVKIIGKDCVYEGLGEYEMSSLKPDTIIQMERIGFGRVDSNNRKGITVYFAHK
ncbi:MAG: glutamate--tRNA ligase [Candidatus Aenigmarchaeota archaeon]|nr:glutamate--tRNA ligase [Candidatus Aenigmarchaeota archaeon]